MLLPRRSLIQAAGGAALAGASAAAPMAPPDADSLVSADRLAIASTAAGKVRGFIRRGVFTFRGIPYGAPAAGERRFLPPAKPAPWKGIRSSLSYGYACPQEPRAHWDKDEVAFVYQWEDPPQNEDCLRLNIWSQGLDSRKRPVMVWLHGGGFNTGAGHEMRVYDGENLARRGDVVVVSLNHRLAALGFLNLGSVLGEKYAAAANVGLLDIIAALEWVRDNIAGFGGDPGNVTLFGQSGGGGKVTALLAMPRAAGLFHRAIVQSGSMLDLPGPEQTAKLAAAVLKELGITRANAGDLHTVPVERIVAAGIAAAKTAAPAVNPSRPFEFDHHGEIAPWAPTVDGSSLPESPFVKSAPAVSANVPLLVGSTLTEFGVGYQWPEFELYSYPSLRPALEKPYGKQNAAKLLETMRRCHPGAKPCDLFAIWQSWAVRRGVLRQAASKAAQGKAPAYVYLFAWNTPVLGGRIRSYHCAELPFVFDNTDRCDSATGGGPAARALAAKVCDAWVQFARTGDPNHSGLPKWPAFRTETQPTMILDNTCTLVNGYDREEQELLAGL